MSDTAGPPQVAPGRRSLAPVFLTTTFLSSLGSVAALLGSTVLSSDAGGSASESATLTSLMLALSFTSSSVTVPYAPALAHRFGTRSVYTMAMTANVALYAALAVALLAGVSPYLALMAVTPLLGGIGGISHALGPPVLKGYLAGQDLATAETRISVASGVAWVIGALAGAVAVDAIGPVAAFAGNAALTVPFVAMLWFLAPAAAIERPGRVSRPWRTLLRATVANGRLGRAALVGVLAAILVAPLAALVVPVTRGLDHDLAIHAGLVLAAISLGAVLSPLPVRQLGTRMGALRSPALAYAGAALVLVVIAVVAIQLSKSAELIAIAAIAVVYGATSTAGSNLLLADAAASAETAEAESQTLAAFFLVTGLATPIGTMLWGRLMGTLSVTVLFLLVGALMIVFVTILFVLLTRKGIHNPPVVRPPPPRHTQGLGHLHRFWP